MRVMGKVCSKQMSAKIAIVTAVGAVCLTLGVLVAFGAKSVGITSVNSNLSESEKIVPVFYKSNVVVNDTFGVVAGPSGTIPQLLIPLYVQTSGPSQRLSEISFSGRFVTTGIPTINVNVGNLTVNLGNLSINVDIGNLSIGNITFSSDPCSGRWNCTAKSMQGYVPNPTTVIVQIPDEKCNGVQECIANGRTPYCPGSTCDNLCMIVNEYNTAFTCATGRNFSEPVDARVQVMSECTREFGSPPRWVKFFPAQRIPFYGYVQRRYLDQNCLDIISEQFHVYGCQTTNPQRFFTSIPCDQACGEDGYGCNVDGIDFDRPRDYCPQTQQCRVLGGYAACENIALIPPFPTPTRFGGVCKSFCDDGYGCVIRPFGNLTTSTVIQNMLVPSLDCPETQNCINNGNVPICVNTTNFAQGRKIRGSCENICVIQRVYRADNCSVGVEQTLIVPAYSCQKTAIPGLTGPDSNFYFRMIPTDGQTIVIYEKYSDPGCNNGIQEDIVNSGACVTTPTASVRFDIVNCDSACAGYGCQDSTLALERPIDNCPNTEACVLDGKIPWCSQTTVGNRLVTSGRCNDFCLQTQIRKFNCTFTLQSSVLSPYECVHLDGLFYMFAYFDGSTATLNRYSDPICQTLLNSYQITPPTCVTIENNKTISATIGYCGQQCIYVDVDQGPGVLNTYLPIENDCSLAPVCDNSGDFNCENLCWGYEIIVTQLDDTWYPFKNVGLIGQCYWDRNFNAYVRLDLISPDRYLFRKYSDILCTLRESFDISDPVTNRINNSDILGLNPIIIRSGECSVFNLQYSPGCEPIFLSGEWFQVSDPGYEAALECQATGLTPVCVDRPSYGQFTNVFSERGWNLECRDMIGVARDYRNFREIVPESPGCVNFEDSGLNPSLHDFALNLDCFELEGIFYSIVPVATKVANVRPNFFVLYNYGTQSGCMQGGSGSPFNPILTGNGLCFGPPDQKFQLWYGLREEMEERFLCRDGFGCKPQRFQIGNSRRYETTVFIAPEYLCPASRSCIESGRSPLCIDNQTGYCGDVVVWLESYVVGSGDGCPNPYNQVISDLKTNHYGVGQCTQAFDDQDFRGVPFNTQLQSFLPIAMLQYETVLINITTTITIDIGAQYVGFKTLNGPCLGVDRRKNYYDELPISYRKSECFPFFDGIERGQSTWKMATREAACGVDGFGCPADTLNNARFGSPNICSVGTCRPQMSCESTRNCYSGGWAFGPAIYTVQSFCTSQALTAGIYFAMGSCVRIPLTSELSTDNNTITFGPLEIPYSEELYNYMLTDSFKKGLSRLNNEPQSIHFPRAERPSLRKRQVADCTIGAALVYSQIPPDHALNISGGVTLYTPINNVIYGQVNSINFDGEMQFEYLSTDDTTWSTIVTNVGEGVYLLAQTTCDDVLVSGTFNYQLTFAP